MTIPTEHDSKIYALSEIARLVRTYQLTSQDLSAIVPAAQASSTVLTRVFSYVGTVLILAGLGIYTGMQWQHFDSVMRVVITFGPGLIALVLALAALKQDNTHSVHATPLFAISCLFQTTGLFVFLQEFAEGNDHVMAVMLVMGVMSLQNLALFVRYRRPALLFFTLSFAHFALAALFEKMGIPGRYYSLVLGLSGLIIASAIRKSTFGSITGIGYLFCGSTLAISVYEILDRTPFDILMIGAAALMIYASVLTQSRMLLGVAIVALLSYLGYYTNRYFADMLGWPIALMVFGLILIVASSYAVKLGRRFTRTA